MREKELRYCIVYINPLFPFLHNGKRNLRHFRAKDEETAESVLTIILSCGCKIVELYRGNVVDGKLGDWQTPMIVDEEDWVTGEWLEGLKADRGKMWHPASELPPTDERGISEKLAVHYDAHETTGLRGCCEAWFDKKRGWTQDGVKQWAYLPD